MNLWGGGGGGVYMYDVRVHYENSMKALIYMYVY